MATRAAITETHLRLRHLRRTDHVMCKNKAGASLPYFFNKSYFSGKNLEEFITHMDPFTADAQRLP